MARSATDLAMLLSIQAGADPRVPLALNEQPDFTVLRPADLGSLRLGWLADLGGYLPMEDGVLSLCEQALQRMESAGVQVEPLSLGTAPQLIWQAWLVWRRALVATRIAPHLAARSGNRDLIKPEALWEHDQAQGLSGNDLLAASAQRSAFYQHLLSLFERYDFLVLPTAQVWPFDAEMRWPEQINGVAMDTYHRWMEVTIYATFAGLPCISLPAGFGASGLPMGLQVIGRPQADLALLRLARAWESVATDILARRPSLPDAA